MFWIISTVILGVAFWGGIISLVVGTSEDAKFGGGATAAIACVLWIIVSFIVSVHSVGQRQVAIVYNFSGTIAGKKDPGVVFTAPWQHVKTENVGIQSEEFDLASDNSAVSLDQQTVYAKLFLNFQVEPGHVVDLYKTVGPQWKHILLDARVLQDFKEVTAGFNAADITANRAALRSRTRARLEQELSPYDVRVVDFFIKNVSFSDAYDNAITARNVQKQKALQAEAKVAQVTAEAQQAVAQAKGQATATAERAAGEARAISIKGAALKQNPQVLALTAIEKLNPNVQVIYTPPGANLFLPSTTK